MACLWHKQHTLALAFALSSYDFMSHLNCNAKLNAAAATTAVWDACRARNQKVLENEARAMNAYNSIRPFAQQFNACDLFIM